MQLPAPERALLVQALITGLDANAGVEEIERRHTQIESGEAQMMPRPETLAAIRAKYA